ncbi:shikimate dehydrogenase [Geobacter pickeringii]|uniref:Shikimate dehydrogenase (NADP(+)) n=1 Tax=Geobacter pickeringii TaxID=345632 RepID=A0A0B5BA01_9BACT|nr:shikimate dehydrogenase [Geobacter pickeringii]AJE03407.1 shikimate dehydrogenase [Geobacter pickeringii]
MTISGKTRILGIIGWPVEHSLSPLMQNAALEEMGLDYVYVPFPVREEGLGAAIGGMRALGVAGFNVTIPHKTAVIPCLDRLAPEAALIGAVNTVKREGDDLVGYNTDGVGFLNSLRDDLGFDPAGARILLLGAGGAGRAALASLCRAGAAQVLIANRNAERGEGLAEEFRSFFSGTQIAAFGLGSPSVTDEIQKVDLLVNTTSVGMGDTVFEGLDLSLLKPDASVYDMVYAPWETPLLKEARRQGVRCANGIGMLVAQGECSLEIWTGKVPPSGVMKSRIWAALGR